MVPKVEKVVDITLELGEAPHWDAETQTLYFVDINGHSIHKYVPATKKHTKAYIGSNVSFIIPVEGKSDQLVISIGREVALISWNGENDKVSIEKTLYEVDKGTGYVFNDGKADPSGRLWAGTIGAPPVNLESIPDGKGTLYSFSNDQITTHVTKLGISNGLAFNLDLKKFYYIDSRKGTVDEYDFDVVDGTIISNKPIFTLKKHDLGEGVFDGMAIDVDGNLWVAVPTTSKVIKIDPRKPETLLETIQFPAQEPTSVAFGGPNLDELYVTTGRLPIKNIKLTSDDGAIYKVTGINTKGLPGERVKL